MKIISKHRDYWHYLQGIYGRDPLLTYDLRNAEAIRLEKYPITGGGEATSQVIEVAFCGKIYFFVARNSMVHHTPEELCDVYNNSPAWCVPSVMFSKKTYRYHCGPPYTIEEMENFYKTRNGSITTINYEKRKPILFRYYNAYDKEWHEPYNLEVLDFHKVADAHTVYTEVSNFLGWLKDHPALPDNQTDKEKVKSHGFDTKKSFRPKMKD